MIGWPHEEQTYFDAIEASSSVNAADCRMPLMWQQVFDPACRLSGQARQDVFKVTIWIVAVELRRLDQAHDGGGSLAGAQRSRKEPVASTKRHRADSVFDVIVVDRQIAIFEIASERCPTTQAVIDGFACGRPVRHLLTLTSEPLAQGFGDGFCALLTQLLPAWGIELQVPRLALDFVKRCEVSQALFGDLAAAICA